MRQLIPLLAVLFCAALTKPAFTDGLLHPLPDDGAWVKYYVVVRIGNTENTRVWRIASVGKHIAGGKDFRWVEFTEHSSDERERLRTIKVLMPEEDFSNGRNPIQNVEKVWVAVGDNQPMEFAKLEQYDPLMAAVLSGPAGKNKTLDEKETVEWQKGQLKCEVSAGSSQLKILALTVGISYRLLRHRDVPFHVAGSKMRLRWTISDQPQEVQVEIVFQGMGKNATSELPDNN